MLDTICYNLNQNIIKETEKNGYFILRDFFKIDAVKQARHEMKGLLDRDIETRKVLDYKKARRYDLDQYRTDLTPLMHTRLNPSWESPTFELMISDMFNSDIISNFMQYTIGNNYRLRLDLIRRSSGLDDTVDDFQIPHEWHRDTPGEFTFGIFFDEMLSPSSGGTAVIPGTHWEKLDPQWDLILSKNARPHRKDFLGKPFSTKKTRIDDKFFDIAKYNRKVRERLKNKPVEILGGMGDIYLFLNDTWHGRKENKTGKKFMLSRVGGFASDFDFKNDRPIPENAPSIMKKLYSLPEKNNTNKNTLVNRIQNRTIQNKDLELAASEKLQLMTDLEKEVLGN